MKFDYIHCVPNYKAAVKYPETPYFTSHWSNLVKITFLALRQLIIAGNFESITIQMTKNIKNLYFKCSNILSQLHRFNIMFTQAS